MVRLSNGPQRGGIGVMYIDIARLHSEDADFLLFVYEIFDIYYFINYTETQKRTEHKKT